MGAQNSKNKTMIKHLSNLARVDYDEERRKLLMKNIAVCDDAQDIETFFCAQFYEAVDWDFLDRDRSGSLSQSQQKSLAIAISDLQMINDKISWDEIKQFRIVSHGVVLLRIMLVKYMHKRNKIMDFDIDKYEHDIGKEYKVYVL
jgi:hypothetical protein